MGSCTVILILALVATNPGATPVAAGAAMDTTAILIDFSTVDRNEWLVINDGVMGGVSRGDLRLTDRETAIFSGELSLENNGGFASVRARLGRRDLSAWDGLEIRVKGDGRTYQLRLRMEDRYDGIAYRTVFETRVGEWITARRSFAEFIPTFRGRTPRGAPPLDPAEIHQVGFLLADKQPGAFELEIEVVRTWAAATEDP